jgi:zinc transport system ATP-binding protein
MAVLGPNGAGKSTLIKAIIGLVETTTGTLKVMGERPKDLSAGSIGYIPQMKSLDRQFPALPIELVASGLTARWPGRITAEARATAMTALERVGMADKALRPISRLSGGELQRIYLARALARRPRLLVLDEPATGMDALGEADMYRLLDNYRREADASVVMITHDWEVAQHHATAVLLLNRRQVAFGDSRQVLTGDNLRRAYGHMGHAHPMDLPVEPHEHPHEGAEHDHDGGHHGHSH